MAEEFGITQENAPRFTAFAVNEGRLRWQLFEENLRLRCWYEAADYRHTGTKKFDFFPFTCGYLEKMLSSE